MFGFGSAQATLHDRGGGLLYDDVLNLTWLQDANYAKTSGYAHSFGMGDGRLDWGQAMHWASTLSYFDSVRGVTYDDWRLPTMITLGVSPCFEDFGTNCGFKAPLYDSTGKVTNELAFMFYVNLGLKGLYNSDGTTNTNWGIFGNGTGSSGGQADVGPVKNLQSYPYWSDAEYTLDSTSNFFRAWYFVNSTGGTHIGYKGSTLINAWAVRPGDVAPVPEPETFAMMLVGLGLIGSIAHRRQRPQ